MDLGRARLVIVLVSLGIGGWLIGRGSAQLAAAALFDVPRAPRPRAAMASAEPAAMDACAFFEAHPVFDSHLALHCDAVDEPRRVEPRREIVSCPSDVRLVATYLRRSDSTRSFAALSDAAGVATLIAEGGTLGERSVLAIHERSILFALPDGATCTLPMSPAREARRSSPVAWVMPE